MNSIWICEIGMFGVDVIFNCMLLFVGWGSLVLGNEGWRSLVFCFFVGFFGFFFIYRKIK